MFAFITKKPLWVNLLVAIGLTLLFLFLVFMTLNFWTNHGEYLRVPDVKGKTFIEAAGFLEKQGFDVVVQDSVYYDTIAPTVVFKQFPDPEATVKVNRTIYLTINRANAPKIEMPNLVGMSFRNAELELKSRGLKLGDTSFVPDIAKNAVKEQIWNGNPIKPGTTITMGQKISLVLGAGIGNEEVPVPNLYGLPYPEALALTEANGIGLFVVLDNDLRDTTAGFVYWQNPDRLDQDRRINRIRAGQMMDIRLSAIKPEPKIDSVTVPPKDTKSEF